MEAAPRRASRHRYFLGNFRAARRDDARLLDAVVRAHAADEFSHFFRRLGHVEALLFGGLFVGRLARL